MTTSSICREAAVVLRLMLASGFLEEMERDREFEIESVVFDTGLPLATRADCMAFFTDRLEVRHLVILSIPSSV